MDADASRDSPNVPEPPSVTGGGRLPGRRRPPYALIGVLLLLPPMLPLEGMPAPLPGPPEVETVATAPQAAGPQAAASDTAGPEATRPEDAPPEPPGSAASGPWPSFRGRNASGVAPETGRPGLWPERWNGESGERVRWKTPIPGLAHSSPIVWGDRLYLTSAVSSREGATFKHGLYGSGDASDDLSPHRFMVYALDKATGEILWEKVATEGVPKEKRHIKATYANSTPATDGRRIVAFFGSQGLYAFDLEGRLLWSKDLGRLDAGAYDAPSYEWGTASSPILWQGRVIVQCDTQEESFLLAADADTGKTLWKVKREELPSWGTPTVFPGSEARPAPELVTNGSNFIRGYDPWTGRELWRLGGSSKITAPTPIFSDEVPGALIFVASGRAPERPIFAVRPGSRGDLSLPEGQDSSPAVAWSKRGRGPYMPTPLAYRGQLYILGNQGVLDAYDLATGREVYRQRIPHSGGGFSASPVAAGGKVYLPGEDGDVFVVEAGDTFRLLATNPMGERLMATPALSQGVIFLRGERSLFAVGGAASRETGQREGGRERRREISFSGRGP